MFEFFWNLGSFLVALGLLVSVHEFGHFWVARRCGVKVERFSIGFGKTLWRRQGQDGTEYVIALIPLGGYVKMLDERVEDVPANLLEQAFNRKSVWQRIAIVAAGPMANFLFAIVVLYVMYLLGVPAVKPVFDTVKADSPAAIVQTDGRMQQIIAVGDQKVQQWEEVNMALMKYIGNAEVPITIAPLDRMQDEGTLKQYTLDTRNWQLDPDKELPSMSLGFVAYRPQIMPTLAMVAEGSAAQVAGLQAGDTIKTVEGAPYDDWYEFADLIKASANTPIALTVQRAGQDYELVLTPKATEGENGRLIGIAGIAPEMANWPETMRLTTQYGIVDAFGAAIDKTWQLIKVSVHMFGKLITGDVSVKSLSGPISIAQGAGNSADIGFVYFLSFLALISVNLGIVNLLPLPVLDGGHLMYYLIEVVTGKPVPEKIQEVGFRFGAVLLLMLMSLALFNDFARL